MEFMEINPFAFSLSWYIAEVVLALYVTDLVSGLVHLVLDYQTIAADELRTHGESTVDDAKIFMATSALFKVGSWRDRNLWKFQNHHDAPYPAADTRVELALQMLLPTSVVFAFAIPLYKVGFLPALAIRLLAWIGVFGAFTQETHFLAHARNRGLVKNRFLLFLQDCRIILHPDDHRLHHQLYDRNFCLLNGWANPVVDCIRRLGTAVGAFPDEPPAIGKYSTSKDQCDGTEKSVSCTSPPRL